MKFQFEQLGSLYKGEVELADLTIICGENNTGKTYITNALYALFVGWQQLLAWDISEKDLRQLQTEGFINIDLQKEIVDNWDIILQKTMGGLTNKLHDFLAIPPSRFESTKFALTIAITDNWITQNFENGLVSSKGKQLVSIKKTANSPIVEIALLLELGDESLPIHSLARFIREQLLEIVLDETFPEVFITSAERTGAAIFKGEINRSKSNLLKLMTEMERNKKRQATISALLKDMKRTYAISIEHNVDFVNMELPELEQFGMSEVIKHNPQLLNLFQKIAGGIYQATQQGAIYFIPHNTTLKMGLGEASSSVRSLMLLGFWLQYKAKVGDMLMIDEPELNLHPANQRRFARFLAALVNVGVKVFLTTHSDYIIREFNTLIMLSNEKAHLKEVRKKFNYAETDRLRAEQVAVYSTTTALFDGKEKPLCTLEKWDVKQYQGIQIKSFDDTINEMNCVQDAILYGVS